MPRAFPVCDPAQAASIECRSSDAGQYGVWEGLRDECGFLHISLGAGESLALYSDCITEAQDPVGDEYQEERLIQSLRDRFEHGAGAMADSVLQDVARFRQTRPPEDDMTLLIVRRRR